MSFTYSLYISHSWSFHDANNKLVALLNSKRNPFHFRNYAVPKNDPVHESTEQHQLRTAIEERMALANVVLILAGVYERYSKWIDMEIEIAQRLHRPIIAVEAWGSEMTSPTVRDAATKVVKWKAEAIQDAIRKMATADSSKTLPSHNPTSLAPCNKP